MVYLCVEDSVSGIEFWKYICKNLFRDIEIVDLGKRSNNTKLAEFVCGITDKENTYLVCYDFAFDNMQVMDTYSQMVRHIKKNQMTNVKLLDIISFEYVLLSFLDLEEWCFASEDEFRNDRKELLKCRKVLLSMDEIENYAELEEIKRFVEVHPKASTIERVCARLLFQITRNTGFVVDKGTLGECWKNNCCIVARNDDDKCGIEEKGFLTEEAKALIVFERSCLKDRFAEFDVQIEDSVKNAILADNQAKNGESRYVKNLFG